MVSLAKLARGTSVVTCNAAKSACSTTVRCSCSSSCTGCSFPQVLSASRRQGRSPLCALRRRGSLIHGVSIYYGIKRRKGKVTIARDLIWLATTSTKWTRFMSYPVTPVGEGCPLSERVFTATKNELLRVNFFRTKVSSD